MENIVTSLLNTLAHTGMKVLVGLVVLVVGFKVINWAMKKIIASKKMEKVDSSVKTFLSNFASVALKVLVAILAAAIIGIPTASLIAVFSSAAVAIGLALQGGLSNIAGGLMILIFKPFETGDFISIGAESGTVTNISIFYTTIITGDNLHIVVPNGTVSSATLTNYSREKKRRLDLAFSVAYDSDLATVERVLAEQADADARVLRDPAYTIALGEHADSALVYYLRVWCAAEDYWNLKFDLQKRVKLAFDATGISIPFPQIDVHQV